MYQGLLNPFLTHQKEGDEQEKVDESHDEEGEGCARECGQPESKGKREINQHSNENHKEHDCQGKGCEQPYHLVNHV